MWRHLLVWSMLAACTAGPSLRRTVTLRPKSRAQVTYTEGTTLLSLVNASASPAEKVYSQAKGDLSLKVIRDQRMQTLLDGLSTLEFFEHAEPGKIPGSRATIEVVLDGKKHVLSRRPNDVRYLEEIGRFNRCMEIVRLVYDRTQAFHTARDVKASSFEETNLELRRNEARQREARQRAAKQEAARQRRGGR